MKNALISPNETVQYISAWGGTAPNTFPVYTDAGKRIAEVSGSTFEIAPPLFWVECNDAVTAESYCYNEGVCIVIPPDAPRPEPVQPVTEGTQTL